MLGPITVQRNDAVCVDDDVIYATPRFYEARLLPIARQMGIPDVSAYVESVRSRPSPDSTRQIVEAHVVLAKGRTGDALLARQLQDHVKSITAPYKYPRIIEFPSSLPMTATGKILKRELTK